MQVACADAGSESSKLCWTGGRQAAIQVDWVPTEQCRLFATIVDLVYSNESLLLDQQ